VIKTNKPATKISKPINNFIASGISIYFTIIFILLYVNNSNDPFGFLYNSDDYSMKNNFITTTPNSVDNNKPPVGLLAKYIIKNFPHLNYKKHKAHKKNNTTLKFISHYKNEIPTNNDLIEKQGNIEASTYHLNTQTQNRYTYNDSANLNPAHNGKTTNSQVSQVPPISRKAMSNQKIITSTIPNSRKSTTNPSTSDTTVNVLVTYPDSPPPFETYQDNKIIAFSCPELITSQMKNKYNFDFLSRMGCNPTFSYN